MPEYIKYTVNAFAILFIIITLIIGLIFRKNRFETSNDDLSNVSYINNYDLCSHYHKWLFLEKDISNDSTTI